MPGDRVIVFDSTLFKNDIDTPLSYTMRPGTIVCRYGYHPYWRQGFCDLRDLYPGGYQVWKYPDLVDINFDHRPDKISHGHFTDGVELEIK